MSEMEVSTPSVDEFAQVSCRHDHDRARQLESSGRAQQRNGRFVSWRERKRKKFRATTSRVKKGKLVPLVLSCHVEVAKKEKVIFLCISLEASRHRAHE